MNVWFRFVRVAPWALVVAAAAAAGCNKTAACRPGTLLVTLNCGGNSAPGGATSARLTLSEGDYTAPPQDFPLTCPQTNHEVSISSYAKDRALTATISNATDDGTSTTVLSGKQLTLADGCTAFNVDLHGAAPSNGDGSTDQTMPVDAINDSPAEGSALDGDAAADDDVSADQPLDLD